MTRKVKVILNPHGGPLNRQEKINQVEHSLKQAGLDYHLEVTHHPKHGTELARRATLIGWPTIVAVGGDGTVNEVINGVLADNSSQHSPQIGIIPTGTANDFANVLQLPQEINAACQRIVIGNTKKIDVGQVNGHYFVNNSAIGLEAVVTVTQNKIRWIHGIPRYVMAALKCIVGAKPWDVRIDWPQGTYEGSIVLVSVGNSNRTGGVFYMTPKAVIDDGLIDFVYGMGMHRWQMVLLMPKLFWGSHIHHSLVVSKQTTSLKIKTNPPSPIQADGEIIATAATEIKYNIKPKRLEVIV